MVDAPDSPEPILETKGPAPVTSSSTARRARTSAKKAVVKKAPAKKVAATKAPAKKVAAKKAPAKKAPAKKVAAKKAPAKKPPAKKVAAKKAPTRRVIRAAAPVTPSPATPSPATPSPAPVLTAVPSQPSGRSNSERFAIQASVTQGMLNDLVLFVVGAGIALPPLEKAMALPAMGEVNVRLALTVTGAQMDLRSADDGRVRVVVSADGDISSVAEDYDGDVVDAGITNPNPGPAALGFPVPPAPIPVLVEALVQPSIELRADHAVSLGIDLRTAELISVRTDTSAPAPAGIDQAGWSGVLAMFSLLLGSMGQGLFDSLGEHVGSVGTELGPEVGSILAELGVAVGPGHISVSDELLSIGLVADDSVIGRAIPVPIAGKRVGLGMASSVVDALAHKLVLQALGDLPLPFELDVVLGEQAVSGRLRNVRVLPASFPDLRSSLRTQVRTRLLRGRLELTVQAAWVELPSVLPSIFNKVSKRLGELVSLAPIRVKFPARIGLPIIPDSTDTIPIEVDDLRVTAEGVGIVVSLA